MKIGVLVKFDYVNGHTRDINNKIGVYLGPRPIHREDGKVINNFMVQFLGEPVPSLCDSSMMKWLKVLP
jgi:hypothetical protein